ncbi:hypothetical protein [Rhodococcus oxybenzonivorans]|uniref:hypothetical protein n=1 Tax=Rhodococcus oxybenzonivorans TaxID=1990687 RepID=UPI001E3B7CC7|nr:hypothetical protein [Rhodococcus oxybenzonivorans]
MSAARVQYVAAEFALGDQSGDLGLRLTDVPRHRSRKILRIASIDVIPRRNLVVGHDVDGTPALSPPQRIGTALLRREQHSRLRSR